MRPPAEPLKGVRSDPSRKQAGDLRKASPTFGEAHKQPQRFNRQTLPRIGSSGTNPQPTGPQLPSAFLRNTVREVASKSGTSWPWSTNQA